MNEHLTNQPKETTARPRAWLSTLMLREPGRWSSRLGALLARLRMLTRGQRRRLGRAAAGVLAGASGVALLALLAGPLAPPVAAAAITVDGTTCTLIDAIKAANSDSAQGGCAAGSGADTITLQADVVLGTSYATYNNSPTGLPKIESVMTIESGIGGPFTISRAITATEKFRLMAVSAPANLTIDNVTLSNGYAYSVTTNGKGGAIFNNDAFVTLNNVSLNDNEAKYGGGAIYQQGSYADLTISDSAFTGNVSKVDGGGIYIMSGAAVITGSNFTANSANMKGGGVYLFSGALTVTNSTFTYNGVGRRGGGVYIDDGTVNITGSTIRGNVANDEGGGIYITDGTVTISNTIISSNTSSYDSGGGLYIDDGVVNIHNSTISYNMCDGDGAGVYINTGTLNIYNTTISDNRSYNNGGALYQNGGDVMVTGSVMSGNYSDGDGGGAIYAYSGTLLLASSVISDNTTTGNGGGIYVYDYASVVISNTTIANNSAGYGGGIYHDGGDLSIIGSTISSNYAGINGGGLAIEGAVTIIENSTFSGNSTSGNGGGIYVLTDEYTTGLDMRHTTLTGNNAGSNGGGLYVNGNYYANSTDYFATVDIELSILSGNTANGAGNEFYVSQPQMTTANNVMGHSGVTYAAAFVGNSLSLTDFDATSDSPSDGTATALSAILETTLADNGGETLTHNLIEGSPAVDIVPGTGCDPEIDQRGTARPQGAGCDAGAVEYVPTEEQPSPSFFVSTWAAGQVGALSYGPHDILQWDGSDWSKWFDGAAAGLDSSRKFKHNINAMWISDTEAADVIMSFTQDARTLPGMSGKVDGMDLVLWDGSAFSLWFDGSDVGLTVKTHEKIDGLHVLPAAPDWSEFSGQSCEAYLLISTQGNGSVPKPGNIKPKNALKFGGEDVLGFCATNIGEGGTTAGNWEMVLDGSAQGVKKSNIDSIAMSADAGTLYLTSKGSFIVDAAFGGHSMVYTFDMTTQAFSGPVFRVYDAGMGINTKVDALQVVGELSAD